jgi:hypothetical protein
MSETTVVNTEHQPLTDEQLAQQQKDMQMAQALMKHSQMELQKATALNNMSFHLFGAMVNGLISKGLTVENVEGMHEQLWNNAKTMAHLAYDEQQVVLEAGSARAQELAEKEIEEGVH